MNVGDALAWFRALEWRRYASLLLVDVRALASALASASLLQLVVIGLGALAIVRALDRVCERLAEMARIHSATGGVSNRLAQAVESATAVFARNGERKRVTVATQRYIVSLPESRSRDNELAIMVESCERLDPTRVAVDCDAATHERLAETHWIDTIVPDFGLPAARRLASTSRSLH